MLIEISLVDLGLIRNLGQQFIKDDDLVYFDFKSDSYLSFDFDKELIVCLLIFFFRFIRLIEEFFLPC